MLEKGTILMMGVRVVATKSLGNTVITSYECFKFFDLIVRVCKLKPKVTLKVHGNG